MSKKRMPEHVAEAVIERSGGKCEAMNFPICVGRAEQLHHRQLRSQGGEHTVVNLIAVCSPCHSRFHREVAEAQSQGWIVRSTREPADVPMKYRGLTSLLDAEGGVTWQKEAEQFAQTLDELQEGG